MATIILRTVKGSALTWQEADDNFSNLNDEIATKLDTSAYTAADVLTKILTVDGTGSGLDADLLDGNEASAFATSGHNHTGVYEPADATILKDADIGVSVAAQSHTHASTAISDSTAAGRSMLTAADAAAQTALLNNFTDSLKGLTPLSGGGTTNFLRADGTWAAPPSGSPGGSNTEVQFNNSGAFGGSADFTWDGTKATVKSASSRLFISPLLAVGSVSGTVNNDLSLDQNRSMTLTGNITTMNLNTPVTGVVYRFIITQGGSGSYTITWPTIKWAGGVAPVLSTAVGAIDIITLWYAGSTWYGMAAAGFA